MLAALVEIVILAAVDWAFLIVALIIAGRMGKVSLPERPELIKQTGLIVLAITGIAVVGGLVFGDSVLAWGPAVVVYWMLLNRWFDVDLAAAIWLIIIGWITRLALSVVAMGVLMAQFA